jgi:MFS family permease
MLSRFKDVLRLRDFRYLAGASAVDAPGSRLMLILLSALIARAQPGKVIAYSQGSLLFALPPILLAPFIGVLADRWDRRRTLAFAELSKVGILLAVPLVSFLTRSWTPIWLLIFLFFAADIFKNSTAPPLLPSIVRPEQIMTANSLWFALARATTVIGFLGGGYLVRLAGWKLSFAANALIHLAAGLLVLGILPSPAFRARTPANIPLHHALRDSLRRFSGQLKEVILVVGQNRYVAFAMFSLLVSSSITGVAYTILQYLVQQKLNLGEAGIGVYMAILAGGMLLGAVLIGLAGDRLSKTRIVVYGCAAIGGLFLIGPWFINVWFIGVMALVAGVAFSGIGIAQTAILQTRVTPEIQGRIFATREFLANVALVAITVPIGAISLVADLTWLLLAIGGGLLVLAAIGYWLAHNL